MIVITMANGDIARYPERNLNPGDNLEMEYIFGRPNDFVCILLHDRLQFEIMDKQIQQYYSVSENVIRPAEVKLGDFLIVLCVPIEAAGEQWTRVQVISELAPPRRSTEFERTFEVSCVDFGAVVNVSLDKMSVVQRKFCEHPKQAHHFQLRNRHGIAFSEWSDEAMEKFEDVARFCVPLKATVMERGVDRVVVWVEAESDNFEDLAEEIRTS